MDVCTACPRAGKDVGTCGSPLTCPKTVRPVDPATDVVVTCALCDVTRVVSVGQMMSGKLPNLENSCQREMVNCLAVLQPSAAAPAPTKKAAQKGA
jgi:hypothetical protein